MNNEQQQIIDEAYRDYCFLCIKETKKQEKEMKEKGGWSTLYLTPYFESKDKFIKLIKTDSEFSDKWELKIEERELSLEERYDLIEDDKHTQFTNWQSLGTDRIKEVLDEKNVPTKLITVTYKDKTIESYE